MPIPPPKLAPRHEAAGLFKAVKYIHRFAKRKDPITSACIYEIHRKIFYKAHPQYRGRLRLDEAQIKGRRILLPHPREIPELFKEFGKDLDSYLAALEKERFKLPTSRTKLDDPKIQEYYQKIFWVAAWAQHTLLEIHPFQDGNGRTARLLTNLILERFGLPGVRVKIEEKNKARYLDALSQADKAKRLGYAKPYGDYDSLIGLIAEGVKERYLERIRGR